MPSKKKKYNARFPAGRIKKIMQTDEEVGKVAQAVPVIISRTLELFVESLLTKSMQITQSRNAKTLTPSHMKQCILSESRFDFLKDLVKNVPDASVQEDNENNALFGADVKSDDNEGNFETSSSAAAGVRTEELRTVFEVSVKAAEASTSEVGLSHAASSTISSNSNHSSSKKASAYLTKRAERTSRRSSAAAAAPSASIMSTIPQNFVLTTTDQRQPMEPSTGPSRMPVIQYGPQVAKLAETKKLTDFSVNSLIDRSSLLANNNDNNSQAQSMTVIAPHHPQNNSITVTVGAQSVVPVVESFRVVQQQQQQQQGSLKRKHSLDSSSSNDSSFISRVLPPPSPSTDINLLLPKLAPISSTSSSHQSSFYNNSQNEADGLCIDEDYDN